ncbi:MAG TPA: type II toxin-antitoxin system VapB family antitoxin [Candidatus Angelobacter sp.]|nr:type II toxin-antitoxin system VapB family antitoxin [Candidatus Angelobacter sp.]
MCKAFSNGNSQAVRLPREFHFKGNKVRIRRAGRNVVLEPVLDDPEEWLRELKSISADPEFMKDRKQPMVPKERAFKTLR